MCTNRLNSHEFAGKPGTCLPIRLGAKIAYKNFDMRRLPSIFARRDALNKPRFP